MVTAVRQIEALYKRLEKARELVASGKVHRIIGMDGHYAVESSKGDGFYLVNGTCGCSDAGHRSDTHKGWCKHKLAVELYREQQGAGEAPTPTTASSYSEEERKRDLDDLFGPQK